MSTDAKDLQDERFPVIGMSCAGCAASVQQLLSNLPGVSSAHVNYANAVAHVQHDESISASELNAALEEIGFGLIVDVEDPENEQQQLEDRAYQKLKRDTIWAAILTLPVFIIGMFAIEWGSRQMGVSWFLHSCTLFWFGRHFYVGAYQQAKYGRANMDTLVALSTGIAFVYSLFNTLFPDLWLSRGT